MTPITVERVTGRAGTRRFIAVAPPLYQDIPAWARPLDAQLRARLDQQREPFWRHAEGQLVIASRHGRDSGRLLVAYDRLRPERLGEKTATFGFFEAPADPAVSRALFAEAERWAAKRGADALAGPFALSVHEEVGLLVAGFERPPCLMMPYNRDYYADLLLQAGFAPVRDFHAYDWDIQGAAVPEPRPLRANVTIRRFDPRRRADEVWRFLQVYNEAFAGNWGFVPMTEAEADGAVGDFLRYADLSLPRLAEVDGEPAGFILALPDFNEVIARCAGKLWPFGLLRLLLGRQAIRNVRVVTLAVRRPFRPMGIAHHLIRELWRTGRAAGYRRAEFGYIDTGNAAMRNIVEGIGARQTKTYRLYRKSL
jgi:ribosomal protein S18 acetylase RimI-like enzyme